MTKGSPARDHHETGLTYCWQYGPSFCSSHLGYVQSLAEGPWPPYSHRMPLRDKVECSLQVEQRKQLLKCTVEYIELIQVFHPQDKTTLFPLNLGFNYSPNSSLHYPGIHFSTETEKCKSPIFRTHAPVPILNRDLQVSLPIGVLSPTAPWWCGHVWAKTTPQYLENWGSWGRSYPPLVPYH